MKRTAAEYERGYKHGFTDALHEAASDWRTQNWAMHEYSDLSIYTQGMDPETLKPTLDWLSSLNDEIVGQGVPGNDDAFNFPSGYVQRVWKNITGSRANPKVKWKQYPIDTLEALDAFMTHLFEQCRAHVRPGRKWDYAQVMYRLYLNEQVQTDWAVESEDDMRRLLESAIDEIEAEWRSHVGLPHVEQPELDI